MIFHRTENVPRFRRYVEYRDRYLRPDFQFRCAYCLTPEFYFLRGEGGEIDHFRPLNPPTSAGEDFRHLENEYANLYWTCGKCNGIKGNTWPSKAEIGRQERFLDPCAEDHDDHWKVEPDGTLVARTSVGQYTVDNIRLNRRRLVDFRKSMADCRQKLRVLEQLLQRGDLASEIRKILLDNLQVIKAIIDPPAG